MRSLRGHWGIWRASWEDRQTQGMLSAARTTAKVTSQGLQGRLLPLPSDTGCPNRHHCHSQHWTETTSHPCGHWRTAVVDPTTEMSGRITLPASYVTQSRFKQLIRISVCWHNGTCRILTWLLRHTVRTSPPSKKKKKGLKSWTDKRMANTFYNINDF